MVGLYLVFGIVDDNGRAETRSYAKWYPHRHVPHHQMFTNLRLNLCEYGTFRSSRYNARHPLTPTLKEATFIVWNKILAQVYASLLLMSPYGCANSCVASEACITVNSKKFEHVLPMW
ncbi:hypothetical protein AVEN_163478-1 [Araneus ventricosus]|uniref:Uncharacterized protein n=1 Tax=Araneus ventricosus TaxID=182803 RepID=A0A4Y2BSJ6_ARAVE|nr:hypothetical protein AVEN_163478-1 [Araneus ventricosus]